MDDTVKLVRMIRISLNNIEVKGEENLDTLLGCIRALETVEQILGAPKETKEETNG